MLGIYHDVSLKARPEKVYAAVTTPQGFNAWWTKNCSGRLLAGELFNFYFSEAYISALRSLSKVTKTACSALNMQAGQQRHRTIEEQIIAGQSIS